jgi:hypothetical protein
MDYIQLAGAIILTFTCLLGCLTNGIVAIAILTKRNLRNISIGVLIALTTLTNSFACLSSYSILAMEYRRVFNTSLISQKQCAMEGLRTFLVTKLTKLILLAVQLFMPAMKLALFALSVDRLYAIVSPVKYRQRNHVKFALKTFCVIYILCILFDIAAAYNSKMSGDIFEICSVTSLLEPNIALIFSVVLMFIDFVMYFLNISFVIILKLKTSSQKIGTNAAKVEHERQVKITSTIMRAVLVHFICGTVPILVYMLCFSIQSIYYIDAYAFILLNQATTILLLFENVINAFVFSMKIPELRNGIWRKQQVNGTSSVMFSLK